jgi:hypothetical protein
MSACASSPSRVASTSVPFERAFPTVTAWRHHNHYQQERARLDRISRWRRGAHHRDLDRQLHRSHVLNIGWRSNCLRDREHGLKPPRS